MKTARIERLTLRELHEHENGDYICGIDYICQDLIKHIQESMALDEGEVTGEYDLFKNMEPLDLADLVFYVSQRFGIREKNVVSFGRPLFEKKVDYTVRDAAIDIHMTITAVERRYK